MKNIYLRVIFLLLTVGLADAADVGNLLVTAGYRKLVIIHPDGS